LVDSLNTYTNCLETTDMYVTGDKAYISMDAQGVLVFGVPDSSIGDEFEQWGSVNGYTPSVQGIHVRTCAYMACEGLNLWIRCNGIDYIKDVTDWSRDVYNVGSTASTTNLTYEAADDYFRVWNTNDLNNIFLVASNNRGGPAYQVVHVTGDWVYRMGSGGQVEAYGVTYGLPNPKLYTAAGSVYHIHEVHSCYWRGPAVPLYGKAHIYGVYENADTVAIWIYHPIPKVQPVKTYKYGDVNNDGIINISDVVAIINYTRINAMITNLDAADVDCDGEVNTYDAAYLTRYLFEYGPLPGADCDFYH